MQNRRAYPRVSLDTVLWLGEDGFYSRSRARIHNISPRGAFLSLTGFYQIGTIMSIRFALDAAFISCTAVVRRTSPGEGVGVEFLDLSDGSSQLLDDYVTGENAAH